MGSLAPTVGSPLVGDTERSPSTHPELRSLLQHSGRERRVHFGDGVVEAEVLESGRSGMRVAAAAEGAGDVAGDAVGTGAKRDAHEIALVDEERGEPVLVPQL